MRLVILGAGGYGRTVADVAEQTGQYGEIVFLDDHAPDAMGKCEDVSRFVGEDTEFYPAFGNNGFRLEWIRRLEEAGGKVATLVHPSAYLSPKATIEVGTVLLPHAVVNTNTLVKRGGIINCNATVDHDCILEEGVHVCLSAVVKAENRLPACLKVEAGQVIENRSYPLNGEK